MQGFEENEISVNSNGGTELSKRSIAQRIPEELLSEFQVVASRIRDLNEEKIRIYWAHDLAEDPEVNHFSNPASRDRFQKMIFVSNWQLQNYVQKLQIPQTNKLQVIENPITPLNFRKKPEDKINLIYFSTPHRGLELLVPVFEELCKRHNNIHLNVFSSFKIYGWEHADEKFKPLFDRIASHPNMTYHGFVEQEVLREHIENSHILAYPSIWQETSCRVLIESMSAGLLCVHPNLAALPETSGALTSMYQYQEDPLKHMAIFYDYLNHAINVVGSEEAQNYLRFVKAYADSRFNLDKISDMWAGVLQELLREYPTVESRSFPKEMFTYKT